MKKLIAVLLALLMMLSFVACLTPETPNTDDTTTAGADPNPDAPEKSPVDKVAGPFEKLVLAMSDKNADKITNALATKGGSIDYDFAYGEGDMGINVDAAYKITPDASLMSYLINAGGQEIDLKGYGSATEFALASELLTNGVWYGMSYANLEESFNNSIFAPGSGSSLEIPQEDYDAIAELVDTIKMYKDAEQLKVYASVVDKIVSYFDAKATETEETLSFRGEEFTATKHDIEFTQADIAAVLVMLKTEYAQNEEFKAAVDAIIEMLAKQQAEDAVDESELETDFNKIIDNAIKDLRDTDFKVSFSYSVVNETAVEFELQITVKQSEVALGYEQEMIIGIKASFGETPSFDNGMEMDASIWVKYTDLETSTTGGQNMKLGLSSKTELDTDKAYRHVIEIEVAAGADMKLTVDLNRETDAYKVELTQGGETLMAIEGTYDVTDTALEFTVSKLTTRSTSYEYDEETEEYIEVSEIVTVEFTLSVKITVGEQTIEAPEYTDIMSMTEAELTELINTIYEKGNGIFGSDDEFDDEYVDW